MCGIAGAFNIPQAAEAVSLMLRALQDRGPETAGITSENCEEFHELPEYGLAGDIFREVDFEQELPGKNAIGSVRYSTAGKKESKKNIQPISAPTPDGGVALAHNGTLTNCPTIINDLGFRSCGTRVESDSNLMLRVLISNTGGDWVSRYKRTFGVVEGAFSIVSITEDGTCLAARDPYGFRPLSYVKYGDGWLVASETCALAPFDYEGEIQQVKPGHILNLTDGKLVEHQYALRQFSRHCSFCETYFARPDSYVFGSSVYSRRDGLGVMLNDIYDFDADIVIPVPDSSLVIANSFAATSGLPYKYGLIKSRYEKRTFIIPGRDQRIFRVRMKYGVVTVVVRDRHVLLIEDSVVRGLTMEYLVPLLKRAGARSVSLCSASPRVISPCCWGIDTPTRQELLAHRMTLEESRKHLGLTELRYPSLEQFSRAFDDEDRTKYCYSCFEDKLPVPDHTPPPGWLVGRK